MDDLELKTLLKAEIANASSSAGSEDELAVRLEQALKYYLGEPFGNEIDERSQVVLTTVRDTIDWILTSLMATFTGGEDVVRFDPTSEADKEQAEIESDVVNHIFTKENEGFMIFYTMFKDALTQKVGITKTYYEDKTEETTENWENQTDFSLAKIIQDEDVEILSHEGIQEILPDGQMVSTHNVKLKRTNKDGGVVVVNVAPEEFLISSNANSGNPSNAEFTAHRVYKTRSGLKNEGFDPEIVDGLASGEEDTYNTGVEIARDYLNSETSYDSNTTTDRSLDKIEVHECFLSVDYDDDGISEYRKVVIAGDEILENEEVDGNPFSAVCPNPLSHKFYGLSVADDTMDLQLIESIILRNVLDNLYASNNQRTVVNSNVNLDDMLTPRPGGVIRTTGVPGQDVMPLPVNNIIDQGLGMINHLEQVKEGRTGVGKTFQGQNADISNDTAHGIERMMSAAERKTDLITRIFAETGVKDIFLKIRKELMTHGEMQQLYINQKDIQIDPTTWQERKSSTVKVGLGTGDRSKMQMTMGKVIESQNMLLQMGSPLVTPDNQYQALIDYGRVSGLQGTTAYFTDPKTLPPAPPQPPPPDPMLEIAKMQAQLDQARLQQKTANDADKLQLQKQADILDYQIEQAKLRQKEMSDQRKHAEAVTGLELEYVRDINGSLV